MEAGMARRVSALAVAPSVEAAGWAGAAAAVEEDEEGEVEEDEEGEVEEVEEGEVEDDEEEEVEEVVKEEGVVLAAPGLFPREAR